VRIQFFVEGHLEQKILSGFIGDWLNPQLSAPIDIPIPIKFSGCGDFLKQIGNAAKGHLEAPDSTDLIAAIGLLDLKGAGRS